MSVSFVKEENNMAKMTEMINKPVANFDFHVEDLFDGVFSRGSILIDRDMKIHVHVHKGSIPKFDEIFLILLGHPDGYRAIARALMFKRKHPYCIDVREGFSGCRDYKLVSAVPISEGTYRKEVKSCLHVSMNDKCNDQDVVNGVFLPDLLAFLRRDQPAFVIDSIEYMISGKSDYGFRASIRFMRNLQKKCYGRKFGYNRPSLISESFLEEEGFIRD